MNGVRCQNWRFGREKADLHLLHDFAAKAAACSTIWVQKPPPNAPLCDLNANDREILSDCSRMAGSNPEREA